MSRISIIIKIILIFFAQFILLLSASLFVFYKYFLFEEEKSLDRSLTYIMNNFNIQQIPYVNYLGLIKYGDEESLIYLKLSEYLKSIEKKYLLDEVLIINGSTYKILVSSEQRDIGSIYQRLETDKFELQKSFIKPIISKLYKDSNGKYYKSAYIGFFSKEKPFIIAMHSPLMVFKYYKTMFKVALVIFVLTIIFFFLLTLILIKFLLKPLTILNKATEKIAKGDFDISIKKYSKDEIGNLTEKFLYMSKELLKRERALKQMPGIIAHEIRNSLASLMINLEYISTNVKIQDETLYQAGREVLDEVNRMNIFVMNFLDYSREIKINKSKHELSEIIREIAHLSEYKNMIFEINGSAIKEVDKKWLKIALNNIIRNSLDATEKKGSVKINITNESIIIKDSGTGIPDEIADNIFDPFFTNKANGTGIGLSITKKIIDLHSWSIQWNKNNKSFQILFS